MQTKPKASRSARKPAAVADTASTAIAVIPPATTEAKPTQAERIAARREHVETAFAAFRKIDAAAAVKSFPIKALASFASSYNRDLSVTTGTCYPSLRQAAYLATLAVSSGVKLADGAVIPRRVTLKSLTGTDVPCVGENGAGSDVIGSGLATYNREAETFTLKPGALSVIVSFVGEANLRRYGAI
jgi:hypothetical protein